MIASMVTAATMTYTVLYGFSGCWITNSSFSHDQSSFNDVDPIMLQVNFVGSKVVGVGPIAKSP